MFLYRDTSIERLSLFVHHGIDADATGVILRHGRVDMTIEPLPPGITLTLVDDSMNEVFLETEERAVGVWEFWRNTDGGVLSDFPFPGNWSIDVSVVFFDGIVRWDYIATSGERVTLEPDAVAVLRAFDTPSRCRTDCTVPRCGDGIVDGGEVCDDGNVAGGDGCASDCKSLFSRGPPRPR
jgi:cysteine-rich repeat protein